MGAASLLITRIARPLRRRGYLPRLLLPLGLLLRLLWLLLRLPRLRLLLLGRLGGTVHTALLSVSRRRSAATATAAATARPAPRGGCCISWGGGAARGFSRPLAWRILLVCH